MKERGLKFFPSQRGLRGSSMGAGEGRRVAFPAGGGGVESLHGTAFCGRNGEPRYPGCMFDYRFSQRPPQPDLRKGP